MCENPSLVDTKFNDDKKHSFKLINSFKYICNDFNASCGKQ